MAKKQIIKNILKSTSPQSLNNYWMDRLVQDPDLYYTFLSRFYLSNNSIDGYQDFLTRLLKHFSGSSRKGQTINSKPILACLNGIYKNIEELIHQGSYILCLQANRQTLQSLGDHFHGFHEGADSITQKMGEFIDLMHSMNVQVIAPEMRDAIYNSTTHLVGHTAIAEMGLVPKLFDSLLVLKNSANEQREILALVNQEIEDLESSRTLKRLEPLLMIKIKILNRLNRQEDIDEFEKEYLHFPLVRKHRINRHINDGDFQRAQDLANEALSLNEEKGTTFITPWVKKLLQIAEREGDREKQVEYNCRLFLETFDMDYFVATKSLENPNQWSKRLNYILTAIRNQKPWYSIDVFAKIYAEERNLPALQNYVAKNANLRLLKKYESILVDYDRDEYLNIYTSVLKRLINSKGDKVTIQKVISHMELLREKGALEHYRQLLNLANKVYLHKVDWKVFKAQSE